MRQCTSIIVLIALVVGITAAVMSTDTAWAGKLEDAIAKTPQGTATGQIDNAAPRGFLGIPGGPQPFWLYCILWGTWVGWVFSSVGAFGGIMAGVGHISVFGLGDYANSFKKSSDSLGKLLTDSIRTSNQYLVGLSGLISSLTYYRMGRLVLPLAVAMGLGAIAGGYAVASLSAGKIDTSLYVGAFGIIVLVIGGVLFYETTPQGQAGKKAAKQAAAAFEKEHIAGNASSYSAGAKGVRLTGWSATRVTFTFYGVEFAFNPIIALIGGFVINGISAFIGVGGGFLYVPFLTTLVGLPMYIVAGTSALAVLVGMIVNIATYMSKGTPIDFLIVGTEMLGIVIGSVLGPITSKKIPDIWLKRLFVVLALYVGIGYTLKGFWGVRLPGL